MPAFGSSIRFRLLLLVLVATLPMLLFSAVLLRRAYQVSTGLIEENALSTARRVALAVDAQVGRAEAVGYGLAELPGDAVNDFSDFEDAATRALTAAGLEGALVLIGPDGNIVADTLRVAGQELGMAEDTAATRRVFATGQSQISGLSTGRLTHEQEVAVHVPVTRDGRVRYDAVISLSARSIGANLAPQTLPEHWFASIVDQSGRTIYDTGTLQSSVGEPISDSVAAMTAQQKEGVGAAISRNRGPVLLGFTRSERTDWLVGVGVPQSVVHGPQLRSIGALAAGGGAVLLVSLGLAWFIGRHITRPLRALARQALGLGRNELPDPHAVRGLAEAEAAAWALHAAGQELSKRETERGAALRRAETSEARLLLAQEVGAIGVWETDLVTGQRTWSQQQYPLYGRDPVAGPPRGSGAWLTMVHPDDRERSGAMLARAYSQPMSYQHEFRIIQPGGTVRWLRSAGRSEFEDGKAVRLIGTTVDVTDRHEAERTLRESAARLEAEVEARTHELAQSEQRFRTYFENSADALVVVRVDEDRFVYETVNKSGELLFGLRHRDVAGKTPAEILPPETVPSVVAGYREVAGTGKPITLERTMAFPSGTLDLETILVPVRDPATQAVIRIISGSRDLTERKRLESRLAHAQRLEAVGQLTGGVAHDFNNLLTVVIGNLSLLRRRLGDDERAVRYLTSVEAAAERGAKLTASLLAFSRRQTLQVEGVDVGARIQDSATLLRRALGEEIEFSLQIPPRLPLANADAAQLEAAVLNLVINARDAIMDAMAVREERRGSLCIELNEAVLLRWDLEGNDEARPGRFVAIEVRDTGMGMSPATRARAFEPFFTTKEIGQGTGLGLSQVFGFVRQLGGHVTLDSTPGQGTRVIMYLPVAQPAQAERQPAPVEPAPLPRGATVLVVEDDSGIRDITAEVLHDAGLHVLTAPNGPAALNVLHGPERVDLLFSDVVMPGGATGIDLARAARALRPRLAVLLTSGYGGPALSRYGAAEGEYEVLAKPYTRAVLLERLSEILAAAPAK
jgi:PAS domain S-box-containing protein